MRRLPILVVLASLTIVPGASAKQSFLIVRDVSVGGFPRDATVGQAVAVFGEPNAGAKPVYDRCTLRWHHLGLTMNTYYSQGALNPCGDSGRHVSTTVTDGRWRTSVGLRIGDPAAKLRRLYPKANYRGRSDWWLILRPFAGVDLPGLSAKLRSGRVISLTVYGPRVAF